MPAPLARIPPPVDTELEHWRPVPGFEGRYDVSDQGRIWTRAYGRCRKQSANDSGHWQVGLGNNPKVLWLVNRLVLTVFDGPCPEGMESLHRNNNPADNRISNLHWGTRSDNGNDRVRHGVHHMAVRDRCKNEHLYVDGSYRINAKGARECKLCDRDKMRHLRAKWGGKKKPAHADLTL